MKQKLRKSISSWIHETLEIEKAHFSFENRQKRSKKLIFGHFRRLTPLRARLGTPTRRRTRRRVPPARRRDPARDPAQGPGPLLGTPDPAGTPPGPLRRASGTPKNRGAPIDH